VAGFGDGAPPDNEARLAWATCGGVRVATCYVPNGRSLDHEHYQYKLRWLDRLAGDLAGSCATSGHIVVCGDFNIAPDDRDVYDPAKFVGATHTSSAERDRLATLTEWGLVDVFREHHDGDGLFSWWDYRGGDFHKKKGMRIDLLLASRSVAEATNVVVVDRNERKGPKDDPPSDHAPVLMDFEL
jgi:exodeoxyribonuclease-3